MANLIRRYLNRLTIVYKDKYQAIWQKYVQSFYPYSFERKKLQTTFGQSSNIDNGVNRYPIFHIRHPSQQYCLSKHLIHKNLLYVVLILYGFTIVWFVLICCNRLLKENDVLFFFRIWVTRISQLRDPCRHLSPILWREFHLKNTDFSSILHKLTI